jgi:hypothetical protein
VEERNLHQQCGVGRHSTSRERGIVNEAAVSFPTVRWRWCR